MAEEELKPTAPDFTVFFVGSYTKSEGHVPNGKGEGISCCRLDRRTGKVTLEYAVNKTNGRDLHNPTYLHYDKTRSELYVVEEVGTDAEVTSVQPRIVVYDFGDVNDRTSAKLFLASDVDAPRVVNCYITRHDDQLWIASYGSGCVMKYPILPDEEDADMKQDEARDKARKRGTNHHNRRCNSKPRPSFFRDDVEQYNYQGHGPNKARQEASHAHHVAFSLDGDWLYVCDLGSDRIWRHNARRSISDTDPTPIAVPPGSGPRHLVFHPTLPRAYVVSELTGNLLVYQYSPSDGSLKLLQTINTYPCDYGGIPSGSGIRIHPSGKAVYVSNRNHNSVAILALDKIGSVLMKKNKIASGGTSFVTESPAIQWIRTGGQCPRDFDIDPSGEWLVIGNQNSDTLAVARIKAPAEVDAKSMELYKCKTPACIAFAC